MGSTWRRVLLMPPRYELWAKPGRGGVAAARVLYQPRRRMRVAGTAITRYLPRRSTTLPAAGIETIVGRVAALAGVRAEPAAALHSRVSDRWVFALMSRNGHGAVIKLGPDDDDGIAREAAMLSTLASSEAKVQIPHVRWHGVHDGRYVIVTDLVMRRSATAEPSLEDARAAACALATSSSGFVVHGDLAPWNLVPTAQGLALLDWEDSRFADDPLHDLAHFVITVGEALRMWRPEAAVRHLRERGCVGWRYLDEIGLEPRSADEHLARFLRRPEAQTSAPDRRRYETAMADALESHRRAGTDA
jgi:hypothetical protein